jgi:hypothetical protein
MLCVSPGAGQAALTCSEGAVIVQFVDDPWGGTPLARQSRHLPVSVVIDASEI